MGESRNDSPPIFISPPPKGQGNQGDQRNPQGVRDLAQTSEDLPRAQSPKKVDPSRGAIYKCRNPVQEKSLEQVLGNLQGYWKSLRDKEDVMDYYETVFGTKIYRRLCALRADVASGKRNEDTVEARRWKFARYLVQTGRISG